MAKEKNANAQENVMAGIIGAILFALVGGILWFVLYQAGFLAGISGLIGVICAVKGYAIFAKKESVKGIIIAIFAAVIIMIIAWYMCLATDVYVVYQEWYESGEIDFSLTFSESVSGAYLFLYEPEIGLAYLKDLGIGLLLCVIGAGGYVSRAVKRIKAEQNPVESVDEPQVSQEMPETEEPEEIQDDIAE